MTLGALEGRIARREALVGVVGLGYVGLPLAAVIADLGFPVIGVDILPARVATVNAGQSPIAGQEPGLAALIARVVAAKRLQATTDYAALARAEVITINVDTPVDADHRPRYRALEAVCAGLGPVLQDGALVIVESTVAPGTVDRLVRPLLEAASGKRAQRDFHLGVCPERVMPGKLLANLAGMSRVCGAGSPEAAAAMVALYRQFVHADLDVSDIITAELVKTTENAYRDVQIAFANEVALICEANGADVWRVRELVNKSPFRQMHLPGAGVGGHCIPKDPWLLAHSVAGAEVPVRLIPAARAVNDGMPAHVAALLGEALATAGRALAGARVLVLGYAYLEDSDDTRNSPSAALVAELQRRGTEVTIHDPYVAGYAGDLYALAAGADAAVLMVRHGVYAGLDLPRLRQAMRTPVLVDGRHVFAAPAAVAAGFVFRGVGLPAHEGPR